jgi:hypothetical protein
MYELGLELLRPVLNRYAVAGGRHTIFSCLHRSLMITWRPWLPPLARRPTKLSRRRHSGLGTTVLTTRPLTEIVWQPDGVADLGAR